MQAHSFRDYAQERLSAAAYQLGWTFTKALPERWADRLFDFIADRVSAQGRGPEQLRRNLSRVVGPENVTRALVRQSMRSYMRYWKEAFRLPSMVGPQLFAELDAGIMRPEYLQWLNASLEKGKGVVLTLPHTGNWDMAGVWLVKEHGVFATVAERLEPESLFEAFVDYRNSLGFEVLALTGGQTPPMERLEEVLNAGGIVCLLGERDLTGRGVPVDFFGEETSMPAGPAALAQKTGAALHVAHSHFGTGTHDWFLTLNPEIDTDRPLPEVVQSIAQEFEANIAAHPADWHMLQPIFYKDLSRRRKIRMGLLPENGDDSPSSGSTP